MEYPLAHDDSGNPIDVPANAAGWLVRRHAGGRGRPAAVYDGDGRPLVVPLESTAAELRGQGCKPGMYRLDAVDAGRRTLEAVAYTEVSFDGAVDEVDGLKAPSGSDAAVAALARAVEAMQRVQAERERAQAEREKVQAEMISRLVDRLAPPAPEVPRNLRDALGEYSDVQKIIRKLTPDDVEAEESPDALEKITDVVQQAVGLATLYVQQKFGINLQPTGDVDGDEAASAESEGAETETAEGSGESESKAEGKPSTADVEAKLTAVFALLTPEHAKQVRSLSKRMPPAVLDQVMAQLMAMSAEDAAAQIRRLLAQHGANGVNGKAPAAAAQAVG